MNLFTKLSMTDRQVVDAIQRVQAASGLNEKERYLSDLVGMEEGQRVIDWCYNPFITFGVTWRKAPDFNDVREDDDPVELPIVHNLLASLSSRAVTGKAARDAVESAFKTLNPYAAYILFLCLNKDLKAGINTATIKAVCPKLIPTFAVMRAHVYEEKRVTEFPVAVEPKLDGNRVTFVAKSGAGGFFTRTGKVIASMDPLVAPMLQTLRSKYAESNGFMTQLSQVNGIPNIVLDGEVMSIDGFDAVNGALNAKDDRSAGLSFHIFDCLSWEEFDAIGAVEVPYVARRQRVNSIVIHASGLGFAQIVRQTPVRRAGSHEEIGAIYQEFRDSGFEGAMVKEVNGFYEKRKSYVWLKMKAEDTEDLPVVGVFQGNTGGRYETTLGGLIVNRNGVNVRVSGFTDTMRERLWQLWLTTCTIMGENPYVGYEGKTFDDPEIGCLLGRLIEVEFHEATKDGSLRHPRFLRFRDDKTGEVEK